MKLLKSLILLFALPPLTVGVLLLSTLEIIDHNMEKIKTFLFWTLLIIFVLCFLGTIGIGVYEFIHGKINDAFIKI